MFSTSSGSSHGEECHYPQTTSLYNITEGVVQENVECGRIRNIVSDNSLITTAVSFSVPSSWMGKNCGLALQIDACTAPKEIDIFTTLPLQLATGSSDGNHRDQFVGRFVVRGHKIAFWELTTDRGPEFPCPAGDIIGYELVGVSNMGELTWRIDGAFGPAMSRLQ